MFLEILTAGKALIDGFNAIAGHKAQNAAHDATVDAANSAFSEASRALTLRQDQEAQAHAQAVHEFSLGTDSQLGGLAANAGAAGVEGHTVDALGADIMARDFNGRDVLSRNFAMTEANIAQQRRAALAERQGRINGTPGANPVATGVQIAGSLAAFGYDWMRLRGPDPTAKTVP